MKVVFILAILLMTGCGDPLTNDEIIAETKKCQNAGLTTGYHSNWRGELVRIVCFPR